MDKWIMTISLLCLFGFFKEIRPSESYLTQYLEGPEWKNLTEEEVDNEIYPVWTYSYVALLFVVLFITDFLRYKPIIVLEGIAYVVTWVLLLWAQGVLAMQFMEFCYGIVTASEIAYYSYIYAKVPKERYKFATALVRSITLFGSFLSGGLAQILVSTDTMDYFTLNYISLVSVSIALIFAIFLPPVPVSIYFHRKKLKSEIRPENSDNAPIPKVDILPQSSIETASSSLSSESEQKYLEIDLTANTENVVLTEKINKADYERVPLKKAAKVIWTDFKSAYTDTYQIKWCLWWALATCSYEQVVNYIQPLWEEIYPSEEHEDIYQGAVDAITTLVGAGAALSIGFLKINWDKWGEITLAIVSLVEAALLLVSAETSNIWIAYVFYGVYVASYYMLITITTFQVAKNLREDSYGLIFGCNQFIALILQTILTVIVVDKNTLDAVPRTQFLIYGGFVGVTGILYLAIAIYSFCNNSNINNTTKEKLSDDGCTEKVVESIGFNEDIDPGEGF